MVVADETGSDPPPRPARRVYRRRLLLVLGGLLLAFGASGLLAARISARRQHLAELRGYLDQAVESGRTETASWANLPPADRRAIALALLRLPEVQWDGTLDDAWLTFLLIDLLQAGYRPADRALAARQLGELATRTRFADPLQRVLPAGLQPATSAMLLAQDRDPSPRVRTAAAAALLRLRPVARSFQIGD